MCERKLSCGGGAVGDVSDGNFRVVRRVGIHHIFTEAHNLCERKLTPGVDLGDASLQRLRGHVDSIVIY